MTVLLVASADALRVDTISRRALLGKATAGVLAAGPLAAFAAEAKADLEQASDGEVYERAAQGKLGVARVITRAEEGTLVLGKGALPYATRQRGQQRGREERVAGAGGRKWEIAHRPLCGPSCSAVRRTWYNRCELPEPGAHHRRGQAGDPIREGQIGDLGR